MAHEYKVFQIEEGKPHAGEWTFTVDGQPSLLYCPTEHGANRSINRLRQGMSKSPPVAMAQAKDARPMTPEDDAVARFMNRGKLGRFKEAEEAFQEKHGKCCKIVIRDSAIIACCDEDGTEHSVGFEEDGVRFKALAKESRRS